MHDALNEPSYAKWVSVREERWELAVITHFSHIHTADSAHSANQLGGDSLSDYK